MRQLCLLQSATGVCYKVRQLFYYKVWLRLLQSATGITKCDWGYYKVRQVLQSATVITKCDSTGCVPPGPENPYPISDQNIRFSLPYFRPDSQNVYPNRDCDRGTAILATLNMIRSDTIQDTVTPQHCAVFFLLCNVRGDTLLVQSCPRPNRRNISPLSEQKGKFYTLDNKCSKMIPFQLGQHTYP